MDFIENTATTISTIIMGSLALGGLYYLYRFWHTQRQKLFAPIDYSVIRSALFNLPFMILLVICLLEMLAGLTPLH